VVQSTQAEKDAAAAAAASGQPVAAPDNTKLLRDFETKVAAALTANMTKNMSAPFFSGITYSASSIRLDPAVDQQIAAAQAKFAETTAAIAQGQKDQADAAARKAVAQTDADARKAVATTDADANAEKQRGYASCPACAEQDMQRLRNEGIKNLPPNVTTLVGQGADVLLQR
jgi:regulator of protease activity HflC (stomatin/prohibitin superfamily)